MSLKFFHIVFIAASCLMALVVGIWALDAYRFDRSTSWLLLAAVAFGGGGGLVVYGTRFLQKARKLGLAGLLAAGTLGLPSDLLACTVCIGNTESSLRAGMNAGILALLGFAGFMIVSFAIFFVQLARKAREAEHADRHVLDSRSGRNTVHA
jgi:hypothetical protein